VRDARDGCFHGSTRSSGQSSYRRIIPAWRKQRKRSSGNSSVTKTFPVDGIRSENGSSGSSTNLAMPDPLSPMFADIRGVVASSTTCQAASGPTSRPTGWPMFVNGYVYTAYPRTRCPDRFDPIGRICGRVPETPLRGHISKYGFAVLRRMAGISPLGGETASSRR